MTVMQSLGTNDAILFVSLLYSCIDLSYEWDQFDLCRRPIHRWLLTSYGCVIAFRVTHLLGTKLSETVENGSSNQNVQTAAADFLLDLRQKGLLPRMLAGFTWLIALPFFVFWTLLGTLWLWEVVRDTPTCTPSPTHLWFSAFWLGLCYIWIAVHAALGTVAWLLEKRVRKAEVDLRAIEDDETRERWGQVSRITSYTSLSQTQSEGSGLTPSEIRALPGLCTHEEEPEEGKEGEECPICITCFAKGDSTRTLRWCGHNFHRSCIDLWLLRRADCPLCKRSVRGEGEA
eukprot:TRINITY_DN115871_c0_g1_i1.p1 TRINITY_DN115871_c0_g1~~TRINITY_DN115871_c0_g1_i1.p1  ORF type:complete len:288 (+),score=37.72 TRINITY_DN115871_c0_g1_i1:77-940(+)